MKEDLQTLIDAVYEFAGRPTRDGAKKLRDLAAELEFKHLADDGKKRITGEENENC